MLQLDFEQRPEYPIWAAKVIDIDRGYFGHCTTIAALKNNQVNAVCVYSSYNGVNCEISVAALSKWWLRKDIVNLWMDYPFNQLGCKRMTLLIKQDNQHVIELAKKLGFKQEGMLRQMYHDDSDCIVFGLLKSERMYGKA